MDEIQLAQDSMEPQVLVNSAVEPRFPQRVGYLITNPATTNFSRRTSRREGS
jgi:hypothetical protein